MSVNDRIFALVFRLRVWIIFLLYGLGFWAPWNRLLDRAPESTLWLGASTLLARATGLDLGFATELVTIAALCCCLAGAALRVWGTACLSASVMRDSAMHGERVVASGPYRHVRNPLYLGTFLFSLGVSILMPPTGALVFLAGTALLEMTLIFGEEAFLLRTQGDAYRGYRDRVPRLLPSVTAKVPASGAQPRFHEGVLAEIMLWGYTGCFAVLAWRYNAFLMIRALLICFGISLVVRAGFAPWKTLEKKTE